MKKAILGLSTLAVLPVVSAQMTGNFGSTMMDGSRGWLSPLVGLVFFAVASFVFSVVFWLTYNWLAKKR